MIMHLVFRLRPAVLLAIAFVMACALGGSPSARAYDASTERILCRLDSVLEKAEVWEGIKEHRISELRKKESGARSLEEKYWIYKDLFDEYSVFDADSAMMYADRNRDIAIRLDDTARITEWNINRSFVLSVTGLLKEAQEVMDSIDIRTVPPELKSKYFNQLAYLYSHYGQYHGNSAASHSNYFVYSRAYEDSTFVHAMPTDPLYLWYKARATDYREGDKRHLFKSELKADLDTSLMNSRIDAMKAYALSDIYKTDGDVDNRLKCLALSAICDIKTANKDMASLEVLGKILFSAGDIDRAYSYIDFCRKQAQGFPNRVRSITLATVEKDIRDRYAARDLSQRKRLHLYLGILSALSVVLVAAVVIIFYKNKKLDDSRKRLSEVNGELESNIGRLEAMQAIQDESNARLKDMNLQLSEVNDRLKEANLIKEEYIGQMFHICSDYIDKLESFRKDVLRKIKAGQTDALQRSIQSPSMMQAELKEFHHSFDTIFLTIFPDFVKDFNKLLRPEEQIVPAEGELLNTPLRIYALVRLGITDSVKIASLLHCSPQTVYNNRLRVRNKAVIPKENFANVVRTLGKFQAE